ncbi:glycosyltransferase family 2 protein [soil metagenome]
MKLSIVIPLFNEEENVIPMVDEIAQVFSDYDYELVLVDDGSTDQTAARVPDHPGIRLVQFESNAGQSAAMYAGIHAACGEIILLLDGDLQNDPNGAPALIRSVESGESDLACGYRTQRKDTRFKRLQSRVANGVRSRFTGDGVRDTGCTLKAMRRECRDALIPFAGMHRFIPALIKGAGFRIAEFPVNHRPRHTGTSKYGGGLGRALPATRDMFGVKWFLSRRFSYKIK